jgi:GAF domain-containing protein
MEKTKKKARYERLFTQIKELFKEKYNATARMATIVAVLHGKMDYFFWTGFYLLDGGELIVGPYQGPLACIKLEKHKGVCWAGIDRKETVLVPDVHQFPGHIACDSRSRSEIVIPLKNGGGEIVGVLDVDSKEFGSFDDTDAESLEKIVGLVFP